MEGIFFVTKRGIKISSIHFPESKFAPGSVYSLLKQKIYLDLDEHARDI